MHLHCAHFLQVQPPQEPSEGSAHREGKAPVFEPRPVTADGEPVCLDSDANDPAVAFSLLQSIQLPGFLKYFQEEGHADNVPYLLSSGLRDALWVSSFYLVYYFVVARLLVTDVCFSFLFFRLAGDNAAGDGEAED